jgi:uncharacterized protein YraI
MSRTLGFTILGGLVILIISATIVAGLLIYTIFMPAGASPSIATPISVGEVAVTPTPTSILLTPTPDDTTETVVTPVATLAVDTATATATATTGPATAVSVVNTPVQYVLALTNVNIRSGPGTGYKVVGWLAAGQTAKVTGANSEGSWWRVTCSDGSNGCWVTAGTSYTQPANAPGTGQPQATPTAGPCTNVATFVADITIPDDSEIVTGVAFIKTWRVRNSGTCTWDGRYQLAHVDGHLLGAVSQQIPLPASVAPGQTIDLSVQLTAPVTAGSYRGDWKLVTPQSHLFGVGRTNAPLWVKIKAIGTPAQDGTISGLVYQDQNENGRYDSGETLMGNREVWLIEGTACHVLQNATRTTTSGVDGRFSFNGRFSGSYCVGLMGSDGLLEDVTTVSVTAGQVVTGANLRALIANGSISGYLWNDYCLLGQNGEPQAGNCVLDGNGYYHADGMIQATESYIAGVTISLRPGPCSSNSGGTVGAVTNSNGRYTFANLNPGTYCVSMNAASPENVPLLLPGDWTFPARGIWYHQITLAPGEHLPVVNFGWDYQLQ